MHLIIEDDSYGSKLLLDYNWLVMLIKQKKIQVILCSNMLYHVGNSEKKIASLDIGPDKGR